MSVSVSVCLCSGVVNHCSLPLPQTEEFVGDLYPSPPEIAFICDALNRHFGRPKNYNGSLRHWNTEYKLEDSANGGRERRARKSTRPACWPAPLATAAAALASACAP